MRNLTYLLIGVIVIVAALIVFFLIGWAGEISFAAANDAVFSPSICDESGVDISSSFTITFNENVSSASVSKYLKVEPEIELGIHQGSSSTEVLLVPAEPLLAGTLYEFSLVTDKKTLYWSFQTAEDLKIVDFSPKHQSVGVPVDGKIVFSLNQMLPIDIDKLDDYINIEPKISGSYSQSGRMLYFVPDNGFSELTVYRIRVTGLPQKSSTQQLAEEYSFSFEIGRADESEAVSSWDISAPDAFVAGEPITFNVDINESILGDEIAAANDNQAAYSVYTELWSFSGADQFAKLLLENEEKIPLWSFSGQHLKTVDTGELTNVASSSFDLDVNSEGEYILSLSEQQDGYYLLSTYFMGERRDVLFQVSNISAYCATGGNRILFWLHDAISGQALSTAKVEVFGKNEIYTSDKNGAIILSRFPQATVYIIRHGDYSLVQVDDGYDGDSLPNTDSFWRYLYLNKDIYQKGDTINYWGMVKPRDGSSLEYSRVSVYLYKVGDTDPISKEYADLDDNIFFGQLELPYLIAGYYRLVISQSGYELISKEFAVGDPTNNIKDISINNSGDSSISMETSSIAINSQYNMRFDMLDADEYLFIRDESSIVGFAVEDSPAHPGVFAPKNNMNYYLWGVAFAEKEYFTTSLVNIVLEAKDRAFDLSVYGDLPAKTEEEKEIIINAVPGAKVMVSIINSSKSKDSNILNEIFSDYSDTSLNYFGSSHGKKSSFSVFSEKDSNDIRQDETVYFSVLTADSDGKISCPIAIDNAGDYYLLIEAIDNSNQIKVGSYCKSFSVNGRSNNNQQSTTSLSYNYDTDIIKDGMVLEDLDNKLLIVSDENHIQSITKLIDYCKLSKVGADGYFASVTSNTILGKMLGSDYFGTNDWQNDSQSFQTDSGGISLFANGEPDLQYSLLVAALESESIDKHMLKQYFYQCLDSEISRSQRIIALVGLAALDCPVMTELLVLSDNSDLSINERLFILWGIELCGGIQNAHNMYHEYFGDTSAFDYIMGLQMDEDAIVDANTIYLFAIINSFWHDIQQIDKILSIKSPYTDNLYFYSFNTLINKILLDNGFNENAEFSYSIDGKNVNVELTNYNYSLYLAKDITSNLTFHPDKDSIYYIVLNNSEK